MNAPVRMLLIVLAMAGLAGMATWWWHQNMEQKWEARSGESEAALRNRMLAASMLLRQQGRSVTVAGSLGELPLHKLPDGTLILADSDGVMEQDKADRLLAWVQRGNTLITQPRWLNTQEEDAVAEEIDEEALEEGVRPATEAQKSDREGDDDNAALEASAAANARASDELVENDPIAARLGVRVHVIDYAPPCDEVKPGARCMPEAQGKHRATMRRITLPGAAYALDLDAGRRKLISLPDAAAPLWGDEDSDTVRLYQEGKGRIVMLADDFFNNEELRNHDHGELLMALAALHRSSNTVMIVKNLDALPWHVLLWRHYSMALLALAAFLALLVWRALRRFGPLLPQPSLERRSLMEHIDASGAWLWKAPDGRQVLLDAARDDALSVIRRRTPALFRLPPQQLGAALARLCDLPEDQVEQALHQAAAPTPLHFTRQIRILQELRNHHER